MLRYRNAFFLQAKTDPCGFYNNLSRKAEKFWYVIPARAGNYKDISIFVSLEASDYAIEYGIDSRSSSLSDEDFDGELSRTAQSLRVDDLRGNDRSTIFCSGVKNLTLASSSTCRSGRMCVPCILSKGQPAFGWRGNDMYGIPLQLRNLCRKEQN